MNVMPNLAPIISEGGPPRAEVPAPGDELVAAVGADTLLLVCFVLAVVALAAVCNVIATRREARKVARTSRKRSDALKELLRSLRMAECIAGIGMWQYDYETGIQQWSDGLKRLFGIDQDAQLCAGDAETVLCVNDVDLVGRIKQHAHRVEPFSFRFELPASDGAMRMIEVEACNLRNTDDQVLRVVAVVRDVTGEIAETGGLELSHEDEHALPPSASAPCESERQMMPSTVDKLTGLANRRQLMRELDRHVLDARLSLKPLVLVMFDIDHFKRVNDNYGRGEGDLILQRVARLAQEQAREADLVGRVGGEEFGWIIPQATDGMARIMTERLRQAIARGSGVGSIAPVTISLGFASIHTGDTALSLFARADAALYDAKHSGRNRVRVAA
ncbi:MAG: diguanylate cyclase [Erythrobacter sp.]